MLFSVMMINKKDEGTSDSRAEKPDLKAIAAPVAGVLFAIILIPFILYGFKDLETPTEHTIEGFASILYKNNAFSFELAGILLFVSIIGICTVIIKKRNKAKKFRCFRKCPKTKEKGAN